MTNNIKDCNALFASIIELMQTSQAAKIEPDYEAYKELSDLILKLDEILTLMMPPELLRLN